MTDPEKPTRRVNSTLGAFAPANSKHLNWLSMWPSKVPQLYLFIWLWTIPALCVIGAGGVLVYASQVPSGVRWTVFATALAIGSSAYLTGGIVGFLFGVPRTVQGSALSKGITQYQGNTNLEQVSEADENHRWHRPRADRSYHTRFEQAR
jgi:hypothetical protein